MKNLAIRYAPFMIPLLCFAAFKAGEKTAKTFPEIWTNIISPALFAFIIVVLILNVFIAIKASYEKGYQDGKATHSTKDPKPK